MCRKGRSTFISLTAVECVRWTHGIKIERNNLLCEQAPTEVFRSIFAWLVTLKLVWCKKPKAMNSVQKNSQIRNFCTEFLHFARSAKITAFYMAKSHVFVFF